MRRACHAHMLARELQRYSKCLAASLRTLFGAPKVSVTLSKVPHIFGIEPATLNLFALTKINHMT